MRKIHTLIPILLMSLVIQYSNASQISGFFIPLETLDGKQTTLTEIQKNKPIYFKIWATWCQTCMQQMPHFQQTHEALGNDIHVIGVNVWINDSIDKIEDVVKQYDLDFPILIDKNGDFAQAFNLKGTPMHVILDSKGRIVHKGHDVSNDLDNKLAVLAKGELSLKTVNEKKESLPRLPIPEKKGSSAILFTATWCDWYLKDTRPLMSENCTKAQSILNNAAEKFSDTNWQLVVNRLWTGKKELLQFTEKYKVVIDSSVDASNRAFLENNVKDFPTLIIYQNGKEKGRITDFSNSEKTEKNVKTLLSN